MSSLLFWTVVIGVLWRVEAALMGDQCDWVGSGLSLSGSDAERVVTPIYLRCREGIVSWVYPRGALRLLFRPHLPSGERDFMICVRVQRRADPPDLFHHPPDKKFNETAERFPARIFIEGPQKLVPLYAPDDGDLRELRCFRSKKGRSALYIEADPEDGPKRRVATLRYEAKPMVRRHYDPATADCRPCTEDELELAFCTSDLVSRGVIVDNEHRPDLDTTQLTWKLTKLIRATGTDTDPVPADLENHEDYFRYDIENTLENHRNHHHKKHRRRKERSLHAHVHVSSICGASSGAGEFLVMARRRLGRYSLVCAPRIEDWQELVGKRNADGSAQCLLHH